MDYEIISESKNYLVAYSFSANIDDILAMFEALLEKNWKFVSTIKGSNGRLNYCFEKVH